MRIIAGEFKGRPIAAPKGQSTRPTGGRTREAVFNLISHAAWAPALDDARVIDLFAGSGALGLEAMSRGAAFCVFVETDSGARGTIRDNCETLGLFGTTRIQRRSATDLGPLPAGVGEPFTIAFRPITRDWSSQPSPSSQPAAGWQRMPSLSLKPLPTKYLHLMAGSGWTNAPTARQRSAS